MKTKFKLNDLFNNDKFLLFFSLFAALVIWLLVVVNVSPATTRVIQGVKVNIDSTVPSQFGLEVFGEKEFTVDVTVDIEHGKTYGSTLQIQERRQGTHQVRTVVLR